MAQPDVKERRFRQRKRLSGLLPGKITVKDSDTALSCTPVDVSKNGLGVIIAEQLPEDAILVLHLKEISVEMTIAWSRPDFGKRDQFRYGLCCQNSKLDLEDVFVKAGCLK